MPKKISETIKIPGVMLVIFF